MAGGSKNLYPKNATFVTATTESELTAEVNLGALTTGLLKHTVAAGVSTPATATADTDYQTALTFGIADTNVSKINDATVIDNDYAKFTATGIEGVPYATVLSDIGAAGADTVTDTITAFATGGQANATALTTNLNHITVCATALDSVKCMATFVAGYRLYVKNDGAAKANLYPASGDQINSLGANVAVEVLPGQAINLVAITADASWLTI